MQNVIQKIHPLQRKKVEHLLSLLLPDEDINTIIIFGSSITNRCHRDSDVDIYVDVEREKKLIHEYIPFKFDLWTNFLVDERLLNEIKKKGLVIYERKSKQ